MAGEWKAPAQRKTSRTLVVCLSARGPDTDACRASSVEDDPVHEGVAEDGEVGTTACRLEIAVIGRAPAGTAVHGVGETPVLSGALWSSGPGIAQVQRRRPEGAVEGPHWSMGARYTGMGPPRAW